MKKVPLKIAKRVCDILCITVIVLVLVFAFIPHGGKRIIGPLLCLVLLLLGIWNLLFLRCPHCGAQAERFGNHFCRRCGERLDDA